MKAAPNRRIGIGLLVAAIVCTGAYLAFRIIAKAQLFYFTFAIEVTYRGKVLDLARTVACVPSKGHGAPATGRSQTAIAERLDDGSGLMVIIPSLCEPEVWPLATDYVPQIFWTENADRPDVLEAYLSEDRLRAGTDGLTLRKVSARPATFTDYIGAKQDFVLLDTDPSSDPFRDYEGKGIEYVGLVARVITAVEWKAVPEIAAFVSHHQGSGDLPLEPYLPFDLHFPIFTQWLAVQGGAPQVEVRRADQEALARLVPLRWAGQAFEIDRTLPGVALMYRADRTPPLNMEVSDKNTPGITRIIQLGDPNNPGGPRWPVRLGTTQCRSGSPSFCYDMKSGEVAELQLLTIFLVEN